MNKYIDLNALNQAFRLQKQYIDTNDLLEKGTAPDSIQQKNGASFATGSNAVALGVRAQAKGIESVAIGSNVSAEEQNSASLFGYLLPIKLTGKANSQTYTVIDFSPLLAPYNTQYYFAQSYLYDMFHNTPIAYVTASELLSDGNYQIELDRTLSDTDIDNVDYAIAINVSHGGVSFQMSKSYGNGSMAVNNSIAYGEFSFAEGLSYVGGDYSHAEGFSRFVKGWASHIEGSNIFDQQVQKGEFHNEYTVPIFSSKHQDILSYKVRSATRIYTIQSYRIKNDLIYFTLNDELPVLFVSFIPPESIGYASHAEGLSTVCMGVSMHAEGMYTYAQGDASHAEGNSCITYGSNSHAEGKGTYTTNDNEHAQGQYNLSNTDITLHSIGIGTMGTPKNAEETSFNGDKYIIGIGGYDGTNLTTSRSLQTVINSKQDAITIDTALSNTSTNLVQNKVVSTAISNLTSRVNVLETNYVTEQEVITMFNSLTI